MLCGGMFPLTLASSNITLAHAAFALALAYPPLPSLALTCSPLPFIDPLCPLSFSPPLIYPHLNRRDCCVDAYGLDFEADEVVGDGSTRLSLGRHRLLLSLLQDEIKRLKEGAGAGMVEGVSAAIKEGESAGNASVTKPTPTANQKATTTATAASNSSS